MVSELGHNAEVGMSITKSGVRLTSLPDVVRQLANSHTAS
jgi:hypothetical protein